MGIEIRKPRLLSTRDVFHFWLKNLEKEKPYLLVKRRNSKSLEESRTTEVWYTVKHEIEYLIHSIAFMEEEARQLEIKDTEKYQFTSMTVKIFNLKKDIYDARSKIDQLHKLPPDSKKLLMTYKLFNEIVCTFNKKAVEAIIEGEKLNLGNRLGFIHIKKINRHHPSINWGESKKEKKRLIAQGIQPKDEEHPDGQEWFVYRMSEYYLRWAWGRRYKDPGIPMLKNAKLYAFYPTCSSSGGKVLGAKGLLAKANNENEFLHLRYETINT